MSILATQSTAAKQYSPYNFLFGESSIFSWARECEFSIFLDKFYTFLGKSFVFSWVTIQYFLGQEFCIRGINLPCDTVMASHCSGRSTHCCASTCIATPVLRCKSVMHADTSGQRIGVFSCRSNHQDAHKLMCTKLKCITFSVKV